jgi:hypothetical protein
VCVVHGLQWMHLHARLKSPHFERKKIITIFVILSLSYLARGIFNSIQTNLRDLQCMGGDQNYLWCLFIIFFYTIELFLPLQILFYF